MKLLADKLVSSALEKYNVPMWVKPYIMKYVKENPVSTIKFAMSFVEIKRKKGQITDKAIVLPNGTKFKKESIMKLLNLFYYGEVSIADVTTSWCESVTDHNAEYVKYFEQMGEHEQRHIRAIKNLIEGLGYRLGEQPKELSEVFTYIKGLDSWPDRIIATNVILRNSYAKTFGFIFYKVFYPVAPEFMRSFGKAFTDTDEEEMWGVQESKRLIGNGAVDEARLILLAHDITVRIARSIDANMKLAKESGIETEAKLLRDIAVAYPFQNLLEMGLDVDVEKEVRAVNRESAK
ncbi:MAG: hypothetical protein KGH60_04690 [Candidatus Micrarchaeota archaeon]|nr:hypothetical protein [Candidatus Micrarchaeota archaeon]